MQNRPPSGPQVGENSIHLAHQATLDGDAGVVVVMVVVVVMMVVVVVVVVVVMVVVVVVLMVVVVVMVVMDLPEKTPSDILVKQSKSLSLLDYEVQIPRIQYHANKFQH